MFDGLLELDNLKKIKAKLDLENGSLITAHTTLPVRYFEISNRCLMERLVPKNTVKKVKLPVTMKNGTIKQNFEPLINKHIKSWCSRRSVSRSRLS